MKSLPTGENYDVIIIGGGPTGSAAAKSITDHGLKALIIEMKKIPRNKCWVGVGKEGGKTQMERFIKFLQEKFEVKLGEL